MRRVQILIVILLVAGCSNRTIYENIQLNNRNQCAELPPSEYEACIEAADRTYDEYERERKEAIDN